MGRRGPLVILPFCPRARREATTFFLVPTLRVGTGRWTLLSAPKLLSPAAAKGVITRSGWRRTRSFLDREVTHMTRSQAMRRTLLGLVFGLVCVVGAGAQTP